VKLPPLEGYVLDAGSGHACVVPADEIHPDLAAWATAYALQAQREALERAAQVCERRAQAQDTHQEARAFWSTAAAIRELLKEST
jgi:hypothetical protein